MKTRMKLVTSMAALLCGLALSAPGTALAAPGISLEAAKLAPQTRAELRASIDKARRVKVSLGNMGGLKWLISG